MELVNGAESYIGQGITDDALVALGRQGRLCARTLDFSNNKLGDDSAVMLAAMESLSCLYLCGNRISTRGAIALASSVSLTALSLSNNVLDDDAAEHLSNSTSISTLFLVGNRIGNRGAMALARSMSLRELVLDGNLIGDEGAVALSEIVSELNRIVGGAA